MPMDGSAARIFGLPVTYRAYDQTYEVAGHRLTALAFRELVMANRPLKDLSSAELGNVLGAQLAAGRKRDTVFGDTNKTYVVGTSPYFDTKSALWNTPVMSSTTNVETVFRVGADGRPEAVTRLVNHPMPSSVRNDGETDMAWLRRRVEEVCWVVPR